MTGKAKEVAAKVCATTGHAFQNFHLNPLVNPRDATQTVDQFEVRCSKCGFTPKQVEDLRDRSESRSKTASAAGGE